MPQSDRSRRDGAETRDYTLWHGGTPEMLERIREQERTTQQPVFILTSSTEEQGLVDFVRCSEAVRQVGL
jgi:CheY-like chemotaxis protein